MLNFFINAALAVSMATAAYSSTEKEDPWSDDFSLSPSHLALDTESEGSEGAKKLERVMTERSVGKIKEMDSLYVRILSAVRTGALSAPSARRGAKISCSLSVDSMLGLNESDVKELEKRNSAITTIYALSLDALTTYKAVNEYEIHELAIRKSIGEITSSAAITFGAVLTTTRKDEPLSDLASSIDKVNWSIKTITNAIASYNANGIGKTPPISIEIVMEMVSRFPGIDFSFNF